MTYVDIEAARAHAREAREEYEQYLRDRESRAGDDSGDEAGEGKEPPSASPTTFSDCAALYEHSGLEYAIATKLGQLGYTTQAAEHAATAAELGVAADSCHESASGGTIEL